MNVGKNAENIWAGKGRAAEQYWSWETGKQRSIWLVNKLKGLNFSSIFEVGILGARNLKYIAESFPVVKIGGLDVSEESIRFAKEKIPQGQFQVKSAYDIDKLEQKWDIIFTMGTAIHLHPALFDEFIGKLIGMTNKYIIHVEQIGSGYVINGPKELNPTSKITEKIRWVPNIVKSYERFGKKVDVEMLPPKIKGTDCTHFCLIRI